MDNPMQTSLYYICTEMLYVFRIPNYSAFVKCLYTDDSRRRDFSFLPSSQCPQLLLPNPSATGTHIFAHMMLVFARCISQ
jgi:hypothetical protein